MKIISSAPGNIFLFGEHSVVYGYPAIIASIDQKTTSTLIPNYKNQITIQSSFGLIKTQINNNSEIRIIEITNKELEIIFFYIKHIVKKFSIKTGFDVNITSQIPVGSGMSSSTAVLCSLFGAISKFASRQINPEKYFDYIYPYQRQIHGGSASGYEIVSSSVGGINYIEKQKDNTLKKANFSKIKLNIIIADTLVKAPTKITVTYHIPTLIKRRKEFVFNQFNKIKNIVDEAVILFSKENLTKIEEKKIGNLINLNQEILDKLYLSHPKIDDCINEALKAGALGAKLSGSGWGGIMFAVVSDVKTKEVKNALERTGAKVIISKIGVPGVRIY